MKARSSVLCEVEIPAISSGVVSERIPITVSSTVCPVWGSRTSIGIGSNVPSSK